MFIWSFVFWRGNFWIKRRDFFGKLILYSCIIISGSIKVFVGRGIVFILLYIKNLKRERDECKCLIFVSFYSFENLKCYGMGLFEIFL